jgi:glycosyltransferase involved in cell wall biosynthesis
MRVYYKMAYSFAAAGMRVSWVGPEITLYGQIPDELEIPITRYLFPCKPGGLGRLIRFFSTYRLAQDVDDVDVFYCPDPDSAYVGWWLARNRGGRVILDLHENFQVPHTVQPKGTGPRWRSFSWLIRRGITFICRRVDMVMGVSDSVLSPYHHSIRDALVVRNCAPKWLFTESVEADKPVTDSFTLMHGTGALARGTDVVLKAVAGAKRKVDGLRLIVFNAFTEHADGYGERAFREQIDQLDVVEQIDLREPIPFRSVLSILQSCDVGLIGYGRRLGVRSLPNRLFEYMATGLAVLAPSYAEEIKEIVESERCGLLVDFEDIEAVADAIVFLYEHPDQRLSMADRGRRAFLERYNWEAEIQPLVDRIQAWFTQHS